MHTKASVIFRTESAKLPMHKMHVHARMIVTMYIVRRYKTASKHAKRLAVALEQMDIQLYN